MLIRMDGGRVMTIKHLTGRIKRKAYRAAEMFHSRMGYALMDSLSKAARTVHHASVAVRSRGEVQYVHEFGINWEKRELH